VWRGENGDLFEVGDIDELTRLLSLYISDRNELTHAKTKSLEYAQFFSLDMIVDKYEQIFLICTKK
jgi:glycosyltransferase involved in cell wall biosynthesis